MCFRILLAAVMLTTALAASAEGKVTFTTGADYSSGKYGQSEKTNITYIPLISKYETDRWLIKAVVPWLQIDGPGGVSGDSRIVTSNVVGNRRTTESGLGDIVLGATYSAIQLNEQKLYVDFGAKLKVPTASESNGLGTGKTDYTVSSDIYKTIHKVTLLGGLGHKVLGDPSGVDLNNVWFGSVGGVYKLDAKNNVGVSVDFREPTTRAGTSLREYSVFYSHRFNETYKLQTYMVTGDTRSSVDFGAGAMLAMSW